MPDLDFQQKLQAARDAQKNAKNVKDGDFPPDPPEGEYIGDLATLRANISSNGNPYVYRAIVIAEGASKGMIARDFASLTQDFLVARMRDYVQGHDGYGWPEELFNLEECERQQTFVYHEDLIDTMRAIEADKPRYRFGFEKKKGFSQIRILEVLGSGETAEAAPPAATTTRKRAAKAPSTPVEAPDDGSALAQRLVLFCAAQGIDGVKEDDDVDTIVEIVKSYSFWSQKVTQKQLDASGFGEYKPDQGMGEEDIELLIEAGLGKEILMPEKGKKRPPQKKK